MSKEETAILNRRLTYARKELYRAGTSIARRLELLEVIYSIRVKLGSPAGSPSNG